MKNNTLALLSAACLSVLLAACGGGGSSDSTSTASSNAIPASFDGTWVYTVPCESTYKRSTVAANGDSYYYGNGNAITIDSTANTLTTKEVIYSDNTCASKAGLATFTDALSEVKPSSASGYTDVRTGIATNTGITYGRDGGSGIALQDAPSKNGAQLQFVAGFAADGKLCARLSNLGTPQDITKANCGVKQ
ncbi:hypothetical protein [Amphibiibacter pelophylacis]|uniref:Uncharacterized protein n=1 Tax=Amphibiibacter pelophylacis TaxID=1799477 RepID=A0ACC6P512_9BURK